MMAKTPRGETGLQEGYIDKGISFWWPMDLDVEALKAKLAALAAEHRDLDAAIARVAELTPFDQLELQRLKKRKLLLKD
jgi:hypothetical protein